MCSGLRTAFRCGVTSPRCSATAIDQLSAGERIRFDYEMPGQDGCAGRVLTRAQPAEADGSLPTTTSSPPPQDMTGAHRSELTIVFDPE